MTAESASQSTIPIQSMNPERRRLVVAGFLSAMVPGGGHFLAGGKLKGFFFLLFFCILLLLYWPIRLPGMLAGSIALVFAMIVLCIWAAVDALYRQGQPHLRPSQWWLTVLLPAALIGASAHSNWALRAAGFGVYEMPSSAMERTLNLGDIFMVDRRYYRHREVARGELIIFSRASEPGITFVKRAIGLPGDTILGSGGRVLVNGTELHEEYVTRQGETLPEMDDFGPIPIPVGKLFVLGDNRNNSRDSRFHDFGFVDLTEVKGKALYTIPSPNGGNLKWLR